MSDFGKFRGVRCPVCEGPLSDALSTAVCPVCGTPHHRECYQKVGHCVHEHLHESGYRFELPEPEEVPEPREGRHTESGDNLGHVCPRCRRRSTSDTLFCPMCGYAFGAAPGTDEPHDPDFTPVSPFSVYFADPLGGVDPTAVIDGVTVSDLALFVGPNTYRYIPRFWSLFSRAKKRAWNWSAFLFPSAWFAFRKMYKQAFFTGILILGFMLLQIPAMSVIYPVIGGLENPSYREMMAAVMQKLAENPDFLPLSHLLLAWAGLAGRLIVRLFSGLLGDWAYLKHATGTVKAVDADEYTEDREQVIHARGSVNLFAAIAAVILLYQLNLWLTVFLLSR